jgi:hypothetical protein
MSDYKFSTVWKYPLDEGASVQEVHVQTATRVVHVGYDPAGVLAMWCEVDPSKNKRTWEIRLVPTGGEIPDGFQYLGTFKKEWFVGHLYAKAIFTKP